MKIDFPVPKQYPQLKRLWQEAFGDSEEFIDGFFYTGFSPARCRCITINRRVVAALYWLDLRYENQRFAYIYAVAVEKNRRGKGLSRVLMDDTHAHLTLRGYDGAMLVPQDAGLRQMYAKLGYRDGTCVSEFTARAGETPEVLRRIDRDTYARLRRQMLPAGGVIQEEENIAYLETIAFFYQGEGLLLAANAVNGKLRCPELLGDPQRAPGILKALNCAGGSFRIPGDEIPFAMFLPLVPEAKKPQYLGLAFD